MTIKNLTKKIVDGLRNKGCNFVLIVQLENKGREVYFSDGVWGYGAIQLQVDLMKYPRPMTLEQAKEALKSCPECNKNETAS